MRWCEVVTREDVLAAVAVVAFVMVLLAASVAHPAEECWTPRVDGKVEKGEPVLKSKGACVRVLLYSIHEHCEGEVGRVEECYVEDVQHVGCVRVACVPA